MNHQVKPIFSPTSYIRFSACNKTFTLRSEYPSIRVKTPQKALLGQIAHKVLEKASKSHQDLNLDNFNSVFDELWKEIEQGYFARYVKEWFPNPVPPINSWKSYFKIKVAAKGLIRARLSGPKGEEPAFSVDVQEFRILLEEYIEDIELGIEGYVDRLVIFPDGIHVYDYKFGQSELDSPEYKIQLGLYSILASRKFGLPVKRAAVIAGGGSERAFQFQDGYLNDLQSGISEAQNVILENRPVARPSLKNCKFCSFKPVCEDFNHVRITSENGIPLVIRGEILDVVQSKVEFTTLTISDGAGETPIQVSKVPSGYNFKEGQHVHISGPMQFFSQSVAEAKPNTIFWPLS